MRSFCAEDNALLFHIVVVILAELDSSCKRGGADITSPLTMRNTLVKLIITGCSGITMLTIIPDHLD